MAGVTLPVPEPSAVDQIEPCVVVHELSRSDTISVSEHQVKNTMSPDCMPVNVMEVMPFDCVAEAVVSATYSTLVMNPPPPLAISNERDKGSILDLS